MGQRGVFRLVSADSPGMPCTINSREWISGDNRSSEDGLRPYGWESYLSLGYDYPKNNGCILQNFSLTVSRREPEPDPYEKFTKGTNKGIMELQYSMDQDPQSYYSIFRMYNERPGYFEDRTEKDLQMGAWGGDGKIDALGENQYLAYWNAWGDTPQPGGQGGPSTPKNKFYVGWYQQNGSFFDQMYYHNKNSKPGIFAIDCKNDSSEVLIKSNLADGSEYCYYKGSEPNFGLIGANVVNGGTNGSYSHTKDNSSSATDQADDSWGGNDGIPGFSFEVTKPQEGDSQADTAFLIGLHKKVTEMKDYMNLDLYTPANYGHLRLGYNGFSSNFFRMGNNSSNSYFTVEMGGNLAEKQFIWAYDYFGHNMGWNLKNQNKIHLWTSEGNFLWLSVPSITSAVGEAAIWASDLNGYNLLWGSKRDGRLQLWSSDGNYISHYVKNEASFWYSPGLNNAANCKFNSNQKKFQIWRNDKNIYIDISTEDIIGLASDSSTVHAKFRIVCAGGKPAKGVDGKDVYVLSTSEFDTGGICAISYGSPF